MYLFSNNKRAYVLCFLLVSLKINYYSIVLSKFCLKLNYFHPKALHVTSSHQNPILPFHPSFKQLLLTSRYRYRLGIYSLGWWEQDKPFIEQQKHIFFQFYTQNIGIFSYKSKDLFPLDTLQMTVFLFLPLPWLLVFVPCSIFLYASFNAHTDACSSLHPPSFT